MAECETNFLQLVLIAIITTLSPSNIFVRFGSKIVEISMNIRIRRNFQKKKIKMKNWVWNYELFSFAQSYRIWGVSMKSSRMNLKGTFMNGMSKYGHDLRLGWGGKFPQETLRAELSLHRRRPYCQIDRKWKGWSHREWKRAMFVALFWYLFRNKSRRKYYW